MGRERRGIRRAAGFLATCLAATSGLVVGSAGAGAVITSPQARADTWVVNGRVSAIARQGNDIYIGGQFSAIGPPTGHAVFVAPGTGKIVSSPVVNGPVLDAAPDGSGGLYIVGAFDSVNGQSRGNGAHITASGSLAAWDPGAFAPIRQIRFVGGNLILAGDFTSIEGVPRAHVAMVDPVHGSPLGWRAETDGSVDALALSPDQTILYIGGTFTKVNGQSRKNAASVAVANAAVASWMPNPNGAVNAIGVSPSGSRVYLGGTFTTVGILPRKKLAAVDAVSALADPTWSADADGTVFTIAVSDTDAVYVGGAFTKLKNKARANVGAVGTGGALLAWNPTATDAVFNIYLPGDGSAYLAGRFGGMRFARRVFQARVDLANGDLFPTVEPFPSAPARVNLPMPNGTVFLGGDFTSVGAVSRPYLARINAVTGQLDPTFTPQLDGLVEALDISDDGTTLYVGGQFNTVNGATRHLAAALSIPGGGVTPFNPNVNGFEVSAITDRGTQVVLGGQFSKVGGIPIANAARVDASDGSLNIGWMPNPNGKVRTAMILADKSVILAGDFTKFGLITNRKYLASVNSTGGVESWDPEPSSFVFAGALSPDGSTFYAGIGGPGGAGGNAIEAFNTNGPGASRWRVDMNGDVQALDLSPDGQTVYAGGHFFNIYATGTTNVVATRNRAIAVRAGDGSLLPWNPPLDFAGVGVFAVLASNDALYLGGEFTRIGAQPTQGLAFFPGTP